VLELTDREDSATGDLVAALDGDPALAANILRFTNSAYAGRPIRAKTVRQAVTMAGRRATRQLCLEAVTFRFFESARGNGRASRGQLHIHAVSVATVAGAAADLVGVPRELPHLAGLLHDCGKLVMPVAFGEQTMDELAAAHPSGVQRSAAEWERLGIDHAYVGALFAAESGLEDDVVAAIAWHHGGRRGCVAPSPSIACVQLADIVVSMLGGAAPDQTLLDEILPSLGLGAAALDQLADCATRQSPGPPMAGLGDRVAQLERLASIDELTGLFNRRHWVSTVKQAIRDGRAGTVLLCDLDYFKAINDTHGHSTGDLVLTEIARVLGKHGIAGRLGGDEFALWLSGDRPGHVADAIVAEVTATFPEGSDLAVGISVGIADCGEDLSHALERADRALYSAKAGGRRRACFAEGELAA
jgi:diguanylate cyclase (GGDEF)-like protein/putative nucleotidyltransferase with HDIG domain